MNLKFFRPPQFESDEDNFRAKFINGFAWSGILVLAYVTIVYLRSPTDDLTLFVLPGLIAVLGVSLFLLHQRRVTAAGQIIVVLGWLGIGLQAYAADGVKDTIILAFIAIGLLASITINRGAGTVVILASIGVIAWLARLEAQGILQVRNQDPSIYGRDIAFIFIIIAMLIYFSTTSLRDAIHRATTSEAQLRATNQTLQELNLSLEERVASRTAELQVAYKQNERRARQFEAITQVTRAINSIQGIEELFQQLTGVISEKFDFYHVGIYLLDENREFAILRAANSEGGKKLIARSHRLRIGQTGIVALVAATGSPRIALDVGADAAYFDNPELPDTRSELALPLQLSGRILGILDVQSQRANAFQAEDVNVLGILADQVAVAIYNAQTFETTRQYLEEARTSSSTYLKQSWRTLNPGTQLLGYSVANNGLVSVDKPLHAPLISRASIDGEPVFENGQVASLAVPIRLGGSIVGALHIQLPEHEWEPDEIDIAEAVADRLSLALESTTLLEATQKRAEIERLTSDITGRIGSSTQINSILRTAAEELSRVLGGSEVLVQIQPLMAQENLEQAKP